MANQETLGASFSIDITSLKAGLAQANRLIRESESEFKAAAAGMDDWTESQEGLEARIKHLNNAQDLQKKKVKALTKEYEEAGYASDDMSAAAVQLRTDINKEKEALAKTEKELAKQTEALEELETAAEDAGDAVEDTGEAAEDAGDGFTVAGGAIATFIGNGLSALVSAAQNAISTVLDLAESTREYRTTMASLENSSKAAGYTAEETQAEFKKLNGVLGDTQGAATTTANLQAIGLEQSKLTELTDGVIGAWARYGDSIPIDGLAEAINHTISLGEVQGTLADVVEWGGGNVDEFNERLANCTTEAERAEEIQKLLAEQGLTESGKAWQENNKSIIDANNAQAEYTDTTAELGEKIEPLTTKLTNLKTSALEWLISTGLPALQSGFDWLKNNIPTVSVVVAGLTAATVGQKIANLANKAALEGMTIAQYAAKIAQDGLNKAMKANAVGLIITGITLLVTAFVQLWQNCEGFRNFWIGLWDIIKNAVLSAVEGIKIAWGWLSEMFTQAVTWINDNVILPVSQFFTELWTGITDGVTSAWESIVSIFTTVAEWFNTNVIQPIWNFIEPFIHNAVVLIEGTWTLIKTVFSVVAEWFNTNVIQPVSQFFSKLWSGISTAAQNAWGAIVGVFSAVSGWFNKNIIQPVGNFFTNMWNGLKNGAKNAWQGVKDIFSPVATFFGDIFGKAWRKVKDIFSTGGKIFDGIKDGIATAFKNIVNGIIRGINKVVAVPFNAINKILTKIKNVSVAGVEPFSGLISTLDVPKIPELATGGIVRKATTAVIGEDGAEAILPLEKNKGYLKTFAKEIAAEMGGGNGVTVYQTNNYKQAYTSRYEQYKSRKQLEATARLMKAGAV